jgi:DNA-binding transcriptional ArsR family regulator
MDRICRACADGTGRKIPGLLRERDMTAGEIAAHFQVTKPTLSKHFAVLREAGLVTDEKKCTNVIVACEFGRSRASIKLTFSRSAPISGLLILARIGSDERRV